MMPEHVVDYTSPQHGKCKLDVNNGFLYDLAGAQVAKLSMRDDSKSSDLSKGVVNFLKDEVYSSRGHIASAYRQGQAVELALRSGNHQEADRILASKGFSSTQSVQMDIGLGVGDVHQAAPLPNYSAGYKQESPVADMYAPPLLVDQISGKYYTWSQDDAFQEAVPINGGTYGNAFEISPRVSNSTYSTQEWALGGFVSTKVEAAADAALKIRMATAKRVMNALLLGREGRVSTLATTSSTWGTSQYTNLSANFQWNGGSSSDPVKDIQAAMEASLLMPTGIIMNYRVWHAFVRNPAVQKYFTYKSSTAPMPSPTQIAALLDLPPIYVSRMRRKVTATTYDFVWPDAAVLVRQPDRMPPVDQEDIASAITFRWNALSAARTVDTQSSSGGFIVREFFNQLRGSMGGSQLVVVMHDAEVQTSQYVGGLIAGVIQ